MASTLTTESGSTVQMVNGDPCNVIWQVGSSATLEGTTGASTFEGNILATTSITLTNPSGVTLTGRLLASGGDVTLISDTITGCACPP